MNRTVAAAVLCLLALSRAVWCVDPPAGWRFGLGGSSLADAGAAGEEAAGMARRALGQIPAKLVVVVSAQPLMTPELIAGVTKHFDRAIVYGCEATSPLTPFGNFPDSPTMDSPVGTAVWALGGDVDVVPETVATPVDDDDAYRNAGMAMGEKLRPEVERSRRPGKFILTFGDQYNGSNKDFAFGLNDALGENHPIVGGAAGNNLAKVVVAGDIVAGVNVGLLIAGDFGIGLALNGGAHTPAIADRTLAEAIADAGGDPFFALVFNCRRRRQGMSERKQLAEELDVIRKRLDGVPFFGFYGPGEIGAKKVGSPAEGAGFTVVAAVLVPLALTDESE